MKNTEWQRAKNQRKCLLPELIKTADKSIKWIWKNLTLFAKFICDRPKKSVHNLSHGDTLLNFAYTCFLVANNAITHI